MRGLISFLINYILTKITMYNKAKDNRLQSLNDLRQKGQDKMSQMFREITAENEAYTLTNN